MNETTNRTQKDLVDWFSHLHTPSLINTQPFSVETQDRRKLTSEFLIGVIEGDGTFSVSLKAHGKVEVYFHITQALSNYNFLLQCNAFMGFIGTVTIVDLPHHQYCRWNIHGLDNQ